MDRRERRDTLSVRVNPSQSRAQAPLAAKLSRAVGRALGLATPSKVLERLEERALLEGSFGAPVALPGPDGQGRIVVVRPDLNAVNPADFFRFVAPANGFVGVLADTANQTSTLDTRVEIFNPAGPGGTTTPIAQGTNNGTLTSGFQRDGWAGFVATAGTEYIVRVSRENATSGVYTLRLRATNATFEMNNDTGEIRETGSDPDDPQAVINNLGGLGDPATRVRQDEVIYRWELPNDANFRRLVTLNAQSTQTSPAARLDTRLEVYNDLGQLIVSDEQTGRLNDAFVTFLAEPGETYFVRVRSDEVRNPNIRLATGPFFLTGDARTNDLEVNPVTRRVSSGGAFPAFADLPAPLPTPDQAVQAPVWQTQSFSFVAQGTGTAIIAMLPGGPPAVVNGAARLYDDRGQLLAFDDNTGGAGGLFPRFTEELEGGRRYYIVLDTFDVDNAGRAARSYQLFIEANHTNNTSGTPTDDHADTPVIPDGVTDEQRLDLNRRAFDRATSLRWSDPFATLDGNRNIVKDRGLRVAASGTGRLLNEAPGSGGAGDTDLFQFVPPTDMLDTYDGNNDDTGLSIALGGTFLATDPSSPISQQTVNLGSANTRHLALWDAGDYWATGPNFTETIQAPGGPFTFTYGFGDNPATPFVGASIRTLFTFDFDGPTGPAPASLVIGGDFELTLPNPLDPTNPFRFQNIISYDFVQGAWGFTARLPSTDGPVFTAAAYTPDATDPDTLELIIGGDFTDGGGNIAAFQGGAWAGPYGNDIGTNGPVFAILEQRLWIAPIDGTQTPPQRDDPSEDGFVLYIGGQFTQFRAGAAAQPADNLAAIIQNDTGAVSPALISGVGLTGGAPGQARINTIKAFTPGNDDTSGGTADFNDIIVFGGYFNQFRGQAVGSLAATSSLYDIGPGPTGFVELDVITNTTNQPEIITRTGTLGGGVDASNPGAPAAQPGVVNALELWNPAEINTPTPRNRMLAIGGDFALPGDVANLALWFPGATLAALNPNAPVGRARQGIDIQRTDGPVFALAAARDEQEPLVVETLDGGAQNGGQQSLYIGGNFANIVTDDGPIAARSVALFSAFTGPAFGDDYFTHVGLNSGVGDLADPAAALGEIRALTGFDDATPGLWDRHDRPATTLSITVQRTFGSEADLTVRVFNSAFELVYGESSAGFTQLDLDRNGAISAAEASSAGMLDASLSTRDTDPGRAATFDGIKVWGGEVYYIEVGGTGQGRYNLSVVADAGPIDLDGDKFREDINLYTVRSTAEPGYSDPFWFRRSMGGPVGGVPSNLIAEEGFEEGWFEPSTQSIVLSDANGDNDARAGGLVNGSATNTGGATPTGNQLRVRRINPAVNEAKAIASDHGVIDDIEDVDLIRFVAEETGTAEVRILTTGIGDTFGESNFSAGGGGFTGLRRDANPLVPDAEARISSTLDSAVRIFNNDFVQIAFNDDNEALRLDRAGDRDGTFVGALTNPVGRSTGTGSANQFEFASRDPRVVFNVVAGETYFIQVESGVRLKQPWLVNPELQNLADDRERIDPREQTATRAIGAYAVLINAQQRLPLAFDPDTGQNVRDDFINGPGAGTWFFTSAVIPLGEEPNTQGSSLGSGSITGVINNTLGNTADTDSFRFIAPGSGQATIRIERIGAGNSLSPTGQLFSVSAQDADPTGTFLPAGPGIITQTVPVTKGEEYALVVGALAGSQGAYRVTISGIAPTDDHADHHRWWNATDITLIDFRGQGTANGIIESAGDTDLFRFEAADFSEFTITVARQQVTLTPRVRVFEVSEAPDTTPVMLQVGEGVGGAEASTTVSVNAARTKGTAERTYRFYYVLVEGADPRSDAGGYTLTINFPATDDHPDGDTNLDGNYDTGEFIFASAPTLDTGSGIGAASGVIERQLDSDLFAFTVPATGVVTVTVTGTPGVNGTLRPRLTFLDANATTLQTVASPDAVPFSAVLTGTFARGTVIRFVVEGVAGGPLGLDTGAYTVSIVAPPLDDHPNRPTLPSNPSQLDPASPEWALATAIPLSTLTGAGGLGSTIPGPVNPRLAPVGDTDLFTFTSLLAGSHTVTIAPIVSATGLLAPRVEIYAAANRTVLLASNSATVVGGTVTVSFDVAQPGVTYFVLVLPLAITGADQTGQYSINIAGPVPTNGGGGGTDPGAIDFNNPTVLVLGQFDGKGSTLGRTLNGQPSAITPAGDRDLYSFTVTAPGPVSVRLSRPEGSLLSASLEVLRDNGDGTRTRVAFDSAGLPGSLGLATFAATAANTRYFVIVDGLGDSTGSYTVEVDAQAATNRLVFPEGFATDFINQFVPIFNPNPFPVTYTIRLRYSFGEFESVLPSSTIGANTRDGYIINARINNEVIRVPGVIPNVPYSVILEWSVPTTNPLTGQAIDPATIQPLGATFSHYDFGGSIGDAFTDRVSQTWAFPRIERNPGSALNFITTWNPESFDVAMRLRVTLANGSTIFVPGPEENNGWRIVPAGRREGIGMDDFPQLGTGIFSAVLETRAANDANQSQYLGLVAGISAYRIGAGQEAAFGSIGDPDLGSRRGAVTNLTAGANVTSDVTFFNPGLEAATVTLTSTFTRTGVAGPARTLQVPAGRSVTLTGASLGVGSGQNLGLRYTSTVPVSVQAVQYQRGDADSANPSARAGNRFFFGDAFINGATAGTLYFETLFFHNPTNQATTVTVRLSFQNRPASEAATITVPLPANGFAELRLHERQEIIGRREPTWYSIDASAPIPFLVNFEHYDLFLGGGWAAAGVPVGIQTPISQI